MLFRVLIMIVLLQSALSLFAQPIFKVVESPRFELHKTLKTSEVQKYFRIQFTGNNSSILYPFKVSHGKFDTLRAIKELLSLEEDVRLCSFPIVCYNPKRSQIYLGTPKDYSIQVEALFIINQIILQDPFDYSSYPILVDKNTKKESSISGSIIKKAFEAYKQWYRKIQYLNYPTHKQHTSIL